ncbi:MAG: terminase large subunit [Candidatus Metalachnospira sp.]
MNKAVEYAECVISGKISAPKYVKKQMSEFAKIARGKDKEFVLSEVKYNKICKILKLLIMPKGLNKGKSMIDCLAGFQWALIVGVLCVVYRSDPRKRRYQNAVLEIARKNGKTFIVAVIFIILLLTEDRFSKLYSVAPDGTISRAIKSEIEEILDCSPALAGTYQGRVKFKKLRDYIKCSITDNVFYPLNYSRNRMDTRQPAVFLVDETGALPNVYPIEAMRSGQIQVFNKLGFIISTKYPTMFNPLEEEVASAKKILDGLKDDKMTFALLYEPDDTKNWMDNDEVLYHSNPLALEIPEILEDLKKKRQDAIDIPSRRENFLTKHCNIVYQGVGTENYIAIEDLQKCKVNEIDWTGRNVYVGFDLSMTTDNSAFAMAAYDENTGGVLADVYAYIPTDRLEEKSKLERIDYKEFISSGKCTACGDRVIDYSVIEKDILNIEEKFGCNVVGVGYDRYNAMSTAQKLEAEGLETIIVRQHSSVLHAPIKWLEELILQGKFAYEENKLLEINFENARCTYDTNLNRYINKKRSIGKVDMLMALINAIYLVQQNEVLEEAQHWGGLMI